jgi:gamma-glutamyltranspeptidase / glutathione hydrolase
VAVQNDEVNPGVLERADLEAYQPVQGSYRGYEIFSMAPPTSGGTALVQMLHILEDYDLAQLGWDNPERIHLFNEAQKVAFADRNRYLADADWVDVPVTGLVSKEFAAERRELIDPEQALPAPVDYGDPWAYQTSSIRPPILAGSLHGDEGYHTTHFSVIDSGRNMVSITSTIERFWGSGLTVPGRGFLLNNQLTDFDAAPVHEDGTPVANRPEGGKQPRRTALDAADTLGGKRPRSSMTPTLVLRDGQPFMAVGSPGGSRIFGIVLNVVTNVIDHDMDPQEAITAARIVNRGGAMEIEADLYDANPELIEALEALGHEVARQEPFGGAHAVMVDPETGRLLGGADPRREGHLAGY